MSPFGALCGKVKDREERLHLSHREESHIKRQVSFIFRVHYSKSCGVNWLELDVVSACWKHAVCLVGKHKHTASEMHKKLKLYQFCFFSDLFLAPRNHVILKGTKSLNVQKSTGNIYMDMCRSKSH